MSNTKTKYYNDINDLGRLKDSEKKQLKPVADKYAFRANDYYLSLINWEDPNDPIRKIVIPNIDELQEWGRLDPSDEQSYTIIPGLEHKYDSTVLLLVSDVCEGICRYCFRKRVFIGGRSERLSDIVAAVDYINKHTEITNVLMTGGDPLSLATSKLEEIVSQIRQIEHVKIIRIGTKMPAFNPYRIIEDESISRFIEKYSTEAQRIYFMTHFVHPNEITEPAKRAVEILYRSGAIVANQSPLICGLNDTPEVLSDLFAKLSFIGAVPYYVFQCRPASGNKAYTVPIEKGYEVFERARSLVSGLAKRARFVMSHSTGKMEIIGLTDDCVYFKYHRAADNSDSGKILIYKRNPNAYWLDDYEEEIVNYPLYMPYRSHGPQ